MTQDGITIKNAQQLIKNHQFDKTLALIEPIITEKRFNSEYFQALVIQSTICRETSKYPQGLLLVDQIIREIQQVHDLTNETEILFETYIVQVDLFRLQGKLDICGDALNKAEQLLTTLQSQVSAKDYRKFQVKFLHTKGTVFASRSSDFNKGLDTLEQCLAIKRQIGDVEEIVSTLNNIAAILLKKGELEQAKAYYIQCLDMKKDVGVINGIAHATINLGTVYALMGDMKQALYYFNDSLELYTQLGNLTSIASALNNIGTIWTMRGELDRALSFLTQCLEIREKIGNKPNIAVTLNNIGKLYHQKGDFKTANTYYERCLKIKLEGSDNLSISDTLVKLINLMIDVRNFDKARASLEQLEQIINVESNKIIHARYLFAKAVYSFTQSSGLKEGQLSFKAITDLFGRYVKAKELLSEIIEGEVVEHSLSVEAIFTLSEILLLELQTFENSATLTELQQLADKLLQIATDQRSYALFVKTYLLQSKLFLLKGNLDETKAVLVKAQKIAEEKGFDKYALIIVSELKNLTGEVEQWMISETAPLSEKLQHIKLGSLIESLKQDNIDHYTEPTVAKTPTYDEIQLFVTQLQKKGVKW